MSAYPRTNWEKRGWLNAISYSACDGRLDPKALTFVSEYHEIRLHSQPTQGASSSASSEEMLQSFLKLQLIKKGNAASEALVISNLQYCFASKVNVDKSQLLLMPEGLKKLNQQDWLLMFSSKCFEISAFHPSYREPGLLSEPSKILIPLINPYLDVENFQGLGFCSNLSIRGECCPQADSQFFFPSIITLGLKLG